VIKLTDLINEMMLQEELVQSDAWKAIQKTIDVLKKKKKVLLLSCSNRYNWDDNAIDVPKSKMIAMYLHSQLTNNSVLIDVPELNIFPCEGNVSRAGGNSCGVLKAALKDKDKNPSGHHRCWASYNNPKDELWKISKELFESDTVIFFSSIRWGQTNMYYQKLIERLTWIENRHTTLGESNLIKDIQSGFICVGQNWNGEVVSETQKDVHKFYGFKPNNDLYWNWQYTKNVNDETQKSYKASHKKFIQDTKIPDNTK
jgi:multimeric flavodoxin WrbA